MVYVGLPRPVVLMCGLMAACISVCPGSPWDKAAAFQLVHHAGIQVDMELPRSPKHNDKASGKLIADMDSWSVNDSPAYTKVVDSKIVADILAGANLNIQDSSGDTPLMYFVQEHNVNEITMLIKLGANINYKSGGRTSLLIAADNGYFDVVKLLLHLGAKCYTPSGIPLRSMAGNRKALSNALANTFRDPPIDTIFRSDPTGVAILLLMMGADPNARNSEGETPLMSGMSYLGNKVLLNSLLKYGADVNASDLNGTSVLAEASLSGSADVVRVLLSKGANPNLADRNGQRPLNLAASRGFTDVVKLLLDYKALPNVHVRSPDDHTTPLTEAINCKYYQIVKQLIDHGADVNYSADGYAPIMYAVTVNDPVILSLLLKHGAKVKVTSPDGKTLLQLNMISDPDDEYGIRELLIKAGEQR